MFLLVSFIVGCSSQTTATPPELPLEKGTTWVYSYESYEQAADPSQVIKATYQLTESVVDVEVISTYRVAHIKREFQLVSADADWAGDFSNQQKEFWYVVKDQQVFQSYQQPDANTSTEELTLVYEFPLSVTKSWCLGMPDSRVPNETVGCEFVGRREVTSQGSHETPAGNFADCYDLIDYFNGGNYFQKFCNDVGIVNMKFDHAGTRFGFEQTLIEYSIGTP